MLNALNNLVPAYAINEFVLDRFQGASSEMVLQTGDPVGNVLSDFDPVRFIEAAKMAEFSSVLLNCGWSFEG